MLMKSQIWCSFTSKNSLTQQKHSHRSQYGQTKPWKHVFFTGNSSTATNLLTPFKQLILDHSAWLSSLRRAGYRGIRKLLIWGLKFDFPFISPLKCLVTAGNNLGVSGSHCTPIPTRGAFSDFSRYRVPAGQWAESAYVRAVYINKSKKLKPVPVVKIFTKGTKIQL